MHIRFTPTSCPMCGGRVQCTEMHYLDSRPTDKLGVGEMFDPGLGTDRRYYCENDHKLEDVTELPDEAHGDDAPRVEIFVRGGVAYVMSCPEGVTVEIRDYDVDGMDDAELDADEFGDRFQRVICVQ